ncbi:MAG: lipase family protein [Deltaproteobacteria bacterium]|nr:lipase family protein [Deltaproteobacteria bacterium]
MDFRKLRVGCMALLGAAWILAAGCGGAAPAAPVPTRGGDLGAADPETGDIFRLPIALELARLDLQSYQMLNDFQSGKPFTLPAPYTLVQTYLTNEPFQGQNFGDQVPIAYVATQGQNIYVVFRGTKTVLEWYDDAQFGQIRYDFLPSGGLTEEGFTNIYTTIHSEIVQTVNQLAQSGNYTTLFVTGHSLGGALAVLAAPELATATSFTSPILYTFAGPRAGNPAFGTKTYAPNVETSWRVVNTNDLVPKLPNEVSVVFQGGTYKTFFYEHVNTEVDITFGNPISGPTDITDIAFDHELCNYYNALCAETSDPASCKQQAG